MEPGAGGQPHGLPGVCPAFGRSMLARGRGRMVHVASIAAHYPQPNSGAYSAAKAGVSMLSRQIAVEWGHEVCAATQSAQG